MNWAFQQLALKIALLSYAYIELWMDFMKFKLQMIFCDSISKLRSLY